MTKMHEIIAAEPSVTAAYNNIREETLKVFDKPDHFLRTTTTKTHFDSEQSRLDVTETKDMVTTVKDRMKYMLEGSFTRYVDIQLQKDATNQVAKADLVVNGQAVLKDVPATMLLQLEKELAKLREVVAKAPTLQPGPVWVKDEGVNLFVTDLPVTFTTKKTMRPVVLVEATDKHPAQVEKVSEDVPVAKVDRRVWSGMLTSVEKSEILGRLDVLLVAAKKARQRANGADVIKSKIGKTLTDFILNGPSAVEAD